MSALSSLIFRKDGELRFLPRKAFELKQSVSYRPFQRFALAGRTNLVGAEVGVYKGENAEHMLQSLSLDRLFLVDPYESYSDYDAQEMKEAKQAARQRLGKFNNAAFIYLPSAVAAQHLPDLDFVYIDGAHDYASVQTDIATWWPKVKTGGFIGGHDFIHIHESVIRAVVEFAFSNHLVLKVESPDWWIQKP